MKRPNAAVIGLLLAALLSSACGSRWTDEQRAAISQRTTRGLSTGDATKTDSGNTATGAAGAGAGATAGASGSATGSNAGSQAAAGSGRTSTQTGPKPCAAASTAPGITDKTITVGSINSLSGPVPGLSASAAAASRSYVAYLNATGGVCGRSIVLKEADDGTDNSRYRTVVTELGPKIFGLAGGFAIGDVGGADLVEAQKLPGVTVPSADSSSNVSTVFDINPPYKNINAVTPKYKWLKDNGATKASVIYLDTDQSRLEAKNHIALMKAAGMQVGDEQPLPLSTLSYDSSARRVASSGADYMWFTAPSDANVSMANALKDTGYKLRWAEYFIYSYGTNFAELAGDAAEGAVNWIRWLPNEEAAKNAELARFLEWMERTAPGETKDSFAADTWASAKVFFDTLEALPGPITRESWVAAMKAIKTYDAGGMYGAIELGIEKSNSCVVGMQVVNGKWKRFQPATGFLC